MEVIQYKLDVFEGPMDLLLHLINKHKLNINDIPIFTLVEQYIDYVRQMKEADMEIASDFLDMAARLVYIKTVSLLPVYEEAEQLKKELTGEILEYRDCKILAEKIAENADGFDYFYRDTMKIETKKSYDRLHESEELFKSYIAAVGRGKRKLPPPLEAFTAIVSKKIVSVSSMVSGIFNKLKKGGKRRFSDFFSDASSRSEMVATFLAVLELIKANKIKANGDGDKMELEESEGASELDLALLDSEYERMGVTNNE